MTGMRGMHVAALAVAGVILSTFLVGSALAAETSNLGTVDVEKAFNGYKKKQQLDQDLAAFVEELRQKLELRQTHRLLDKEEFSQLEELKGKSKATDAEGKKIEEIEGLSREREKELQTLQQKVGPTDEEKARLIALQDQAKKSDEELKGTEKEFEREVNKRRIDLSQEVMGEVEAAVAAVAKQKGLDVVFNKSLGELGFIIYSSVDITEDVLKRLNRE